MISLKEQLGSRLSSHVSASLAADHARCSTASLERLLDETDEYCRTHYEREDGEEMFKRIRNKRQASVKIGIADGQYSFKPDFDKKFDGMDAEIVAEFGEQSKKVAEDRRGELPLSVQEIVGILPADIDVEKVYREHLEEKYR